MKNPTVLKEVRCKKCGKLLCKALGEVEVKCKSTECKKDPFTRVNNNIVRN